MPSESAMRAIESLSKAGLVSWMDAKECAEIIDAAFAAERAEAEKLRAAIRKHHSQHADDRCWLDDCELYAAAGLEPPDNRVGAPEAMLANCKRFVEHRCQGGGPWKSYAELEATIKAARDKLQTIVEVDGIDRGVIYLSNDGPCHYDHEQKCQVYDHENFSPLGDALIELWEILGGGDA